MITDITAVLIVKNGGRHLHRCLEALRVFTEVVLQDNESTDDTVAIASAFANVRISRAPFTGFGPMKNQAASLAHNDWIFSIDADEVPDALLLDELNKMDFAKLPAATVFSMRRDNHYRGKLMKCCGWENDVVVRIYNRLHTRYAERQVHEFIEKKPDSITKKLQGRLLHYPYDSVRQLIQKMDHYASLYAEEHFRKKTSGPVKAALKGAFTLMRDYFFKKGMLYGGEGLLLAVCNANGSFYKYMKLHEKNQSLRISLIITTYNRPDALELVLKSVLEQTLAPDEIIIADDGSKKDTAEVVEKYRSVFKMPVVHVWQPDEGFRLAQIRNKAIAAARHEYLVMVDGDMVLHPDFIRIQHRLAWHNTYIQGKRVLVDAGETSAMLKKMKIVRFHFFSKGIRNRFNSVSCVWLTTLLSRKQNSIDSVKGCSMAFWKENAVAVNGFNEDFTGWGREDSEFVARLLNAGYIRKNMIFGAVAYHLHHPEVSRKELPENDQLLARTLEQRLTRCSKGMDKYTETN